MLGAIVDVIVGIGAASLVVFSIIYAIVRKKKGKTSCGCDCPGCSGSCGCDKDEKEKEKIV
ncbi:MAG: FeoB-associated Cys-rich membrane protein [Christensenellaceae bacterium]|nr:FeoB-associated Cys-rich membrane protein [Christensenellaceae bacterium]